MGRWIEKEPLGFAGSMNFYVYAGNDPVNRIDPTGLKAIVLIEWSNSAGHVVIWVENTGGYEYTIDGEKSNKAALYDPLGRYSLNKSNNIAIGPRASISEYINYWRTQGKEPNNTYELFEYNTSAEEEKTLINAMIAEGPGVDSFPPHYCSIASYNVLKQMDKFYTPRAILARALIPFKSLHPYRLSWFLKQAGADSYQVITPDMKYSE